MLSFDSESEFLVDSLWCAVCRRRLRPASYGEDGRFYVCGPACPRPALPAGPIEHDLVLRASLRALVTLYPDVARVTYVGDRLADLADWNTDHHPAPDPAEVRRWERIAWGDHRAMIREAFLRVEVDAAGGIHPVWRHRAEGLS